MSERKKRIALYTLRCAAAIIIVAVVAAAISLAVINAQESRLAENAAIVEKGVRRAAVQCYATEGFYPDSIDYLIERYGLFTDSEHCIIHYSPISSNVMPDIRVIIKQEAANEQRQNN